MKKILAGAALLLPLLLLLLMSKSREKKVVHLKASMALRNRETHRISQIDSFHLPQEADKFFVENQNVYYTTYETSNTLYAEYSMHSSRSISTKELTTIRGFNKISIGIFLLTDRNAIIRDSLNKNLEVTLGGDIWRGVATKGKIVFNAGDDSMFKFYLFNIKTLSFEDSITAGEIYNEQERDMDLKATGSFCSNDSLICYITLKGSIGFVFDVDNFRNYKTIRTIDSLPLPKIIIKQLSPEMTQRLPEPEAYINMSAALSNKSLYVLSELNPNSKKKAPLIDEYSINDFRYVRSYDVNKGSLSPREIYYDAIAKKLWVLYGDQVTLISYAL